MPGYWCCCATCHGRRRSADLLAKGGGQQSVYRCVSERRSHARGSEGTANHSLVITTLASISDERTNEPASQRFAHICISICESVFTCLCKKKKKKTRTDTLTRRHVGTCRGDTLVTSPRQGKRSSLQKRLFSCGLEAEARGVWQIYSDVSGD